MSRALIATGRNCALWAVVAMVAMGGCRREGESKEQADYVDASIARFHPLGWLGGRAHPATRTVEFADPEASGKLRATGGMVVTNVTPDAPLAKAGVLRGDVIVRVGRNWLPNKEDPSLDLFRALEAEISAGLASIELGVFRSGKLRAATLTHGLVPLEVGLPAASERFSAIVRVGLDRLVALQQPDGSFTGSTKNVDETVTTCAVAGLAFLAGGGGADDGPHAEAVARCRERVDAALADESSILGSWSTAWATMFMAELSGPLNIATSIPTSLLPAFAMKPGATRTLTMPSGDAKGGFVFSTGGDSETAKVDSDRAAGGNVMFSTGGGLPEGMDLDELMKSGKVQIMTLGANGALSMPGGSTSAEPETEFVEGPAWKLDDLEPLAGKETIKRLQPLASAVRRLVALQRDCGGWDAESSKRGFSETTLVTNQALIALGMAQRAGVPVDGKVVRAGLEFVRAATNDGHVFAVDVPGFDRRREAGRSSGAAAALNALDCLETDEFLKELVTYSDRNGAAIPAGGVAVPLHVLNTAILRRQRGAGSWATFFEEFKHLIVSLQDPDGSFAASPKQVEGAAEFDALYNGEAIRTASWSLVAALQADRVPLLTARATNPLQRAIVSDGARVVRAGVTFDGTPKIMDDKEAREMLERMGVDLEEVLKKSLQTGGGQPGGGE